MHYAIRRFFIVALLTSPGYSLSPIVITNLPDTFSCASERTPVKILSLDTALHFKGLFTLSCPGTGSQDFALEKQPSAITTPLISSLHPCECLPPEATCATFSLHAAGIQYVIKSATRTFYLKPIAVHVNTRTAVMDSVRMIVDSVSLLVPSFAAMPRTPPSSAVAKEKAYGAKCTDISGRKIGNVPRTPGIYLLRDNMKFNGTAAFKDQKKTK